MSPACCWRAGPSYGLRVTEAAPTETELPRIGGFDALLGMRLDEAGPDEVRTSVEITPELLQPYGILHGGVLCSMVETTGSVAAALWYGDRGHVVGTANHTNFLRAAREGTLTARATPVHRGRTQQLWNIDITDVAGRLIAKGELRVTNLSSADALGR